MYSNTLQFELFDRLKNCHGLLLVIMICFLWVTLGFSQQESWDRVHSEKIDHKHVQQEFSVDGSTYILHELVFSIENIEVVDPRVNARGEVTLASQSFIYHYDGGEVRRVPLPKKLITEQAAKLNAMSNGWVYVGSDLFEVGKYVRQITIFHENTKEQLDPCIYGSDPRLCETSFNNSSLLDDSTLIVSTEKQGLFIVQRDKVLFVPDSEGFYLLGSFGKWVLAIEHESGRFKTIAYDGKAIQMGTLPALPRFFRASWVMEGGGTLFIGNNSRVQFFSLPLEAKDLSSSDWKFTELPEEKNIPLLLPGDGLFALLQDKRFYRLTDSGPVYSKFYNEIRKLLGDNRLVAAIDIRPSVSGTSLFATKKGLAYITKKKVDSHPAFPVRLLPGLSTRKMFASEEDQALWVTSYSDLVKLDLASLKDTLIPMRIPEIQRECFGSVNQNFASNESGMLAVDGWNIKYFDRQTGRCYTFTNPSPDKSRIFGLTTVSDGSFLVGTGTGLFLLDPTELEEELQAVPIQLESGENVEEVISVNRLKRKGNSDTILVCAEKGLYISFFEGGSHPKMSLIEHVSDKSIFDAHFLGDGELLLATEGEGMLWLGPMPDREVVYRFNNDNHLRLDYTHNIQEDSQGRIWLSSNNGLYVIDLEEKRLATFGEREGFPSDEFNRISSAVLSDSLMVFGGVNGLGFFNPHDFSFPEKASEVAIRMLKVSLDSQLVLVSPNRFIDSLPLFTLPAEARYFYAVGDFDFFPQTENLYYRYASDSSFWLQAEQGQIPVPAEMMRENLLLKWQVGPDRYYYSEITVEKKSENTLFYTQMVLALLVVIAAMAILISRLRRQKESSTAEENKLDQDKEVSSKTKPTSSSPPPLSKREQFLRELKEKETQEYLFDKKGESALLRKTLSFVEKEMPSSDFSVQAVAKECNLSSRQFHRRIVDETGLTPNHLFTLVRLRHAKNTLIADSSVTVTELANQTGYNSKSYFSKKFKKFYGYSPKEFSQLLMELGKA